MTFQSRRDTIIKFKMISKLWDYEIVRWKST